MGVGRKKSKEAATKEAAAELKKGNGKEITVERSNNKNEKGPKRQQQAQVNQFMDLAGDWENSLLQQQLERNQQT